MVSDSRTHNIHNTKLVHFFFNKIGLRTHNVRDEGLVLQIVNTYCCIFAFRTELCASFEKDKNMFFYLVFT